MMRGPCRGGEERVELTLVMVDPIVQMGRRHERPHGLQSSGPRPGAPRGANGIDGEDDEVETAQKTCGGREGRKPLIAKRPGIGVQHEGHREANHRGQHQERGVDITRDAHQSAGGGGQQMKPKVVVRVGVGLKERIGRRKIICPSDGRRNGQMFVPIGHRQRMNATRVREAERIRRSERAEERTLRPWSGLV